MNKWTMNTYVVCFNSSNSLKFSIKFNNHNNITQPTDIISPNIIVSSKMGQQSSTVEFPKNTWQQFKKDGPITVYYNGNGSFSEKKSLTQDKKLQANEELQIYKLRSETTLPIVKVYNVQLVEEKKNFCSTLHKMTTWIEYVPNRLSYVKAFTLSEGECLYVLQQCLSAFHEIFKRFGYFEINPEMIGFNVEGQVKCWLNKNYENNRIENGNDSVLSSDDSSSIKNFEKMDTRLKQSIEKGMVSDLWEIVKNRSNIQNRDYYNKLSNLEACNFENGLKLVQYLISKNHSKVPSSLFFQNCSQFSNMKHREFSYGDVYNEQNSVTKAVQMYDVQLLQKGILNFNFESSGLNFRDFDLYREHIDSLHPKKNCKSSNQINISFEMIPRFHTKKTDNPQSTEKKLPKNVLKLVDKTIDISLSSIPQNPSSKTIQGDTQPTLKRIQSQQNLFLPLQTNLQKTYSILVPNATSERYILNEIPANQPMGYPLLRSVKIGPPIDGNQMLAEHTDPIFLENYPSLYKKSTSRYVPPPPISGIVKRQQNIMGFSNEPNTPQFNKLGYH